MIDSKRDLTVLEIWNRLPLFRKSQIMKLFPDGKTIDNPEIREYLLRNYKDKLVEVIVK